MLFKTFILLSKHITESDLFLLNIALNECF